MLPCFQYSIRPMNQKIDVYTELTLMTFDKQLGTELDVIEPNSQQTTWKHRVLRDIGPTDVLGDTRIKQWYMDIGQWTKKKPTLFENCKPL